MSEPTSRLAVQLRGVSKRFPGVRRSRREGQQQHAEQHKAAQLRADVFGQQIPVLLERYFQVILLDPGDGGDGLLRQRYISYTIGW